VIFPYIEDNIRAVRSRGKTVNAPVAVAKVSARSNPPEMAVSRSEYAIPVPDSKLYTDLFVAVVAGDELYYPALASISAQFLVYAFRGLDCIYEPVCGTNTPGQLAIAAVPTFEALGGVTTWDDLVALSTCSTTTVWQGMRYHVSPQVLNTQFKEWKVVTPSSAVDYSDPSECQGFIIIGVQGCATTATTTVGRVTVSYDAVLRKPRLDPVVASMNTWLAPGAIDGDLVSGSSHFATVTGSGLASEPSYEVTAKARTNMLVFVSAEAVGALAPVCGAAPGCAVHELFSTGAAAKCGGLFVVVPDGSATPVFTITLPEAPMSAPYSNVRIMVRCVGRERFWIDE